MATQSSFGYINWSEATLERVFKERDDNNHPPVNQVMVGEWRKFSPVSSKACGEMMKLLDR